MFIHRHYVSAAADAVAPSGGSTHFNEFCL